MYLQTRSYGLLFNHNVLHSNVPYSDKLETLRKAIEKETFEFNNIKINITITIGAAEYEENMSLDKWVEAADKKMYRGKNSGKNQIVF